MYYRTDRVTIKDVAVQEDEARKQEKEKKIAAEKRKKESNRMIAEAIAHELQQEQGGNPFIKYVIAILPCRAIQSNNKYCSSPSKHPPLCKRPPPYFCR